MLMEMHKKINNVSRTLTKCPKTNIPILTGIYVK